MRLSRRRILTETGDGLLRARGRRRARRPLSRRRSRTASTLGESLEQRVVLSDWGGNLLGSALDAAGVVTGPVIAPTPSNSSESNPQPSQLQTDIQALRTELANLAQKSGLTVADLTALATDS